MIANQRFDVRPMEQAGALHGIARERVEQERTKNATEPFVGGNVKAFLAALKNGGGECVAHQVARQNFEAPDADLLVFGQRRGEPPEGAARALGAARES